ncbi:MAG: division/cell wall cluster transcriptional repressor MraZ [Saprospiraceae bacterium]
MFRLTGEYQATIDDKGRLKMPSGLAKQFLDQAIALNFMINRGFEKCLNIYPKTVWEETAAKVDRLNIYDQDERQFMRYFYRGATAVIADTAERLLIPKSLADFAGLKKEIVLFAYQNMVELWDAKEYEAALANEPGQFSELATKVFGNKNSAQSLIQQA